MRGKKPDPTAQVDGELTEIAVASTTTADVSDGSWAKEGCDQCGHSDLTAGAQLAQAWFRFTLPSGLTLTMCAHHGHQAEARMAALGAGVEDLTATLA